MTRDAANTGHEGHFLVLAANIDQGVAISRAGQISWASARFARELGAFEPNELVGRSMDSLIRDAGEMLPAAEGAGGAVFRLRLATRPYEIEITCLGEASPSSDDGPHEELWLLRQLSSNREVTLLREQLRSEISEREQLLSVVSHELRTPVTVIRGYNNLLLSSQVGTLNEEQRAFVDESNRSCERLNRFIGDLLSSCSEEQHGLSPELAPSPVEPLVRGVLAFLRPLLEERGLRVEVDLDPNAAWARFDSSRIEQVLTNLLGNAIRYSKAQSRVRIRSRPVEAFGRRFVELSVSDSGPGVAPANRSRIFEPYVRVDGERRTGGLGLGLAICKRIVAAHGGNIGVSDEPGWGSCFSFTLEAAEPADGD